MKHNPKRLWLILTIAISALAGCNVRHADADSKINAIARPSKVLTPADVESLPASVNGSPIPVGRHPGIIIALTPNSSGEFNEVSAKSIKDRAYSELLERLSRRSATFFIALAVNVEKLPLFKRAVANRQLTQQSQEEMTTLYRQDFQPWQDAQLLEKQLLVIDDRKKFVHLAFDLRIPQLPEPSGSIGVAVVSKLGEVYGPYNVGGTPQQIQTQVDEIFNQLSSLDAHAELPSTSSHAIAVNEL